MPFAENYFAIQQSMNVSVWMTHNCMHKSSDVLLPTIFLVLLRLLRGRPWHLTPTSGLVVTLSATCFPVLSRRTCQTLWRVTLVAIVAITNPLIQNFAGFEICHFFKRVGWHRVVEDDDIGIRLPNCQIRCFEHFGLIPKMHSSTHSKQFEKIPLQTLSRRQVSSSSCVSFMGTTVKNTVCRPSFTSFLPAIRPD